MEKTARAPLLPFKISLRSELFASTFTYGSLAFVRLGSSLILTRVLTPTVYGLFAILLSFVFTMELLSDVGPAALVIRHPRGGEVAFVHTIWTIRLGRGILNFAILFLCAPLIAALYKQPALIGPCRLLSVIFLLTGAESMAYILAQRNQKARIGNYAEFCSNLVMTAVVIGLAFLLRNVYALLFGFLLQRAILVVISHCLYRDIGVGLAFDREAIREQFRFARVVTPSSIVTMMLNQYDKLVFLRLFSAPLLGVYSIAGNMLAPAKSIISNNARLILYARCAEYFRSDRTTARERYYRENKKLIFLGMLLPAVVAGFSQSIVSVLYDPRYEFGGYVLMVLGLGTMVSAFFNASENVLVAAGLTHAVLVGNALTLVALVPASLLGYHFYGMKGFLWFNLGATFVPLFYVYHQQHKLKLLKARIELQWMATALGVFLICLLLSHILLAVVPQSWLHLHLKSHGSQ
jgi:O-antigen/teichoic acid export membrane protein